MKMRGGEDEPKQFFRKIILKVFVILYTILEEF